jgi:hypothetical protein
LILHTFHGVRRLCGSWSLQGAWTDAVEGKRDTPHGEKNWNSMVHRCAWMGPALGLDVAEAGSSDGILVSSLLVGVLV